MTTTDPQPDLTTRAPAEPLHDALLLQAVRDGSTAAFGILYTRYRAYALRVALRSMAKADPALAEDVVEVAFVRVLTALRNGKGPDDALQAYLTTTVRREVWRAQRRIRRQAEVVDRWAVDEAQRFDESAAPDAGDRSIGTHRLLVEAFRSLSDRWRQVLWLTEIEGRKPADLAGLFGISAASAAALSYRARNGLIDAYFAAYGRHAGPVCAGLADELGRYLAAGRPEEGFAEVAAHLDTCADCRDASKGIDVAGSVLATLAPFGLLSTGLWAKTAVAGASGLAGAASAAATAGVLAQAGAATSTGGAATAVGVGVAASVVVAVAAGAAWFGLTRPPSPSATAAPATTAVTSPVASTPVASSPSEPVVDGTVVDAAPPPAATSAVATRGTATVPAGPPPTTPSRSETTRPAATSTTAIATSSTAATSTSTSTSTTVPRGGGQLSGRAIETDPPGDGDHDRPVPGVDVVAYDDGGSLAGTGRTGADGRWAIDALAPGRYYVVAIVPVAYRPRDGGDPWVAGDTWPAPLGQIDLAADPLDLVDLWLVAR